MKKSIEKSTFRKSFRISSYDFSTSFYDQAIHPLPRVWKIEKYCFLKNLWLFQHMPLVTSSCYLTAGGTSTENDVITLKSIVLYEHSNILLEVILTNQITCGCTETYHFDWNLYFSFRQVNWIYSGANTVNFDWNYLEFQVSDQKATGLKRSVIGLFEHF